MDKDINIELMTQIRLCENIVKRTKNPKYKGHGRILSFLANGKKLTQSELADALEIRPQSLTRVLLEMEEDGQIIRQRDESDHRIVKVQRTEKGYADYLIMKEHRARRAESIFSSLNEDEKKQLHELLDKVIISYNQKEEADV